MRTSTICKGTKHLTMEEIVQKAALIHERMSGNPNFPDAGPLLAVLDARRRAMEVANDRCLFFGGRIATAHRHDCRAALERAIDAVYLHVRYVVGHDLQKALTSGFTARKAPRPLPVPEAPERLRVQRTGHTGSLLVRWQPRHGACAYEVEMRPANAADDAPMDTLLVRRAKALVDGLAPGVEYRFRVRARFAQGATPYSQGVVCMAA